MRGCLVTGRENKVKVERYKNNLEEEPKEDARMVHQIPLQPTQSGCVLLEVGIAPTRFSHSLERATTQPSSSHPQMRNALLKYIFPLDLPRIGNPGAEEGINLTSPPCRTSIPRNSTCHSNTFPLSRHRRRIPSLYRPPILPVTPGTATGLSQTRFLSSSSISISARSFCLHTEAGKGQRETSELWPSPTGSRHSHVYLYDI